MTNTSTMQTNTENYLRALFQYSVPDVDALLDDSAVITIYVPGSAEEEIVKLTLSKGELLERMTAYGRDLSQDRGNSNVEVGLTDTVCLSDTMVATGSNVGFTRNPAPVGSPWHIAHLGQSPENFVYGNMLQVKFGENNLITHIEQGLFPQNGNKKKFAFIG